VPHAAPEWAPAAPPRDSPLGDMETEFVRLVIMDRHDRVVGADHVAHPAPDAGVGDVRPLADPVVNAEEIARLLRKSEGNLEDPFAVDAQFDCLYGTDRRAAAAEGALLLAPEELPGQILRT
jgi:hypothetical protein